MRKQILSKIANRWTGVMVALLLAASGALAADTVIRQYSHVKISTEVLRPLADETLTVAYLLESFGSTQLTFYDHQFVAVRTIVRSPDPRGLAQVHWDGRNDDGEFVPPGPYFFTIRTQFENGSQALYDPTLGSGGEKMSIPLYPQSYDPDSGLIGFALPQAARVRLRAGLHEGPMYATILDWVGLPAGPHEVYWDGYSDDKQVHVAGQEQTVLTVEAFSLPANSIIVEGTPPAAATDGPPGEAQRVPANISAVASRNYYLIGNRLETSPDFDITVDGRVPPVGEAVTVGSEVRLQVVTSEAIRRELELTRFELVVFVDDARQDEVEYGYLPMTYLLDTTDFSDGEHLLTLSLYTITGQRTSRSVHIQVGAAQ